jgi:hypothetical protein
VVNKNQRKGGGNRAWSLLIGTMDRKAEKSRCKMAHQEHKNEESEYNGESKTYIFMALSLAPVDGKRKVRFNKPYL